MSSAKRRRSSRKRSMKRNLQKLLCTILLAPARMPKIRLTILDNTIRACEVTGIIFVILLLISLTTPTGLYVILSVCFAMIFVVLLFVIKLSEYQEHLEELIQKS